MEFSLLFVLVAFLVLAGVIGYFVVWGVTPALHTPLMAVTNAISGIVIVAAILVAGPALLDAASLCGNLPCPYAEESIGMQLFAKILGFLAVTLCAVNIFGGFAITSRMLAMFRPRQNTNQTSSDRK